jgi:hypothetical protein
MPIEKKIIVTGATGLIGRRLCNRLIAQNWQVVVFSRQPEKARNVLPGAAEYVAWTPGELGDWAKSLEGARAVVHLAGAPISEGLLGPRWTAEYKARIRDSRVEGTRSLVAGLAEAKQRPQVLVSASGAGYYGHRDDTPLAENAAPGDDFLAQVCVDWEREARRAEELGIRTVCTRNGLVLDPDSGVLPQIMQPFRFFSGGPVYPGTQWYSWIHPIDEIGIILLALDNTQASGPINATAPQPVTSREFSDILGKVMGSPSWLPVPEFAIHSILGEMADLITTGQRVLPRKAQELGYEFRFPELEPALRDLLKR